MNKLAAIFSLTVLAAAALAQKPENEDYILGPEDVISVTVIRHPEFSGDFLIPAAGNIDVPAVGSFKASGLSLADTASHIRKALSKRLISPEVSVSLKVARLRRFSVIGNVNRPGAFELKQGWRVTEALGAAGGLPPDSQTKDFRANLLRAADGKKIPISLTEAVAGNVDQNLVIGEGDVLTIEAIELVPIYVVGKVKSPALYKLPIDSTGVVEAITLAGGLTEDAQVSGVKVIHANGQEETIDLTPIILKGEKVPLPKLGPNDLIVIPEAQARFAVIGTVLSPGFFPIPEGREVRLADAVALARADPKRARLARVGIVRVVDGKEQRTQYDVGKYLKKGDTSQNPILKSGDVVYIPESVGFDWSGIAPGLSIASLLFRGMR
jgi:polysaccharide export outer membrane protein